MCALLRQSFCQLTDIVMYAVTKLWYRCKNRTVNGRLYSVFCYPLPAYITVINGFSASLFVCLSVCLFLCLSVRPCLCVSISVCMSVYVSVCASRVSYIFCDPVLACITVIPVLLLHRLPLLVEDFMCIEHHQSVATNHNTSSSSSGAVSSCLNGSSSVLATVSHGHHHLRNMTTHDRLTLMGSLVSARTSICCSSVIRLTRVLWNEIIYHSLYHRSRNAS